MRMSSVAARGKDQAGKRRPPSGCSLAPGIATWLELARPRGPDNLSGRRAARARDDVDLAVVGGRLTATSGAAARAAPAARMAAAARSALMSGTTEACSAAASSATSAHVAAMHVGTTDAFRSASPSAKSRRSLPVPVRPGQERRARLGERLGVRSREPQEAVLQRDRLSCRRRASRRARGLADDGRRERSRECSGGPRGRRPVDRAECGDHLVGGELGRVQIHVSRRASRRRASARLRGVGSMPDSASADSRSDTSRARSSASCSARATRPSSSACSGGSVCAASPTRRSGLEHGDQSRTSSFHVVAAHRITRLQDGRRGRDLPRRPSISPGNARCGWRSCPPAGRARLRSCGSSRRVRRTGRGCRGTARRAPLERPLDVERRSTSARLSTDGSATSTSAAVRRLAAVRACSMQHRRVSWPIQAGSPRRAGAQPPAARVPSRTPPETSSSASCGAAEAADADRIDVAREPVDEHRPGFAVAARGSARPGARRFQGAEPASSARSSSPLAASRRPA